MMIRLALLSATLVFALTPAMASAQNLPNGQPCPINTPSVCQSNYCAVLPGSSAAGSGVCSNTPLSGNGGGAGGSSSGYSGSPYSGSSFNTPGTNAVGQGQAADSSGTSLAKTIAAILAFLIRIGWIVVIFLLVYAGYLFLAARGDQSQTADARRALRWTVIAALVVIGLQAIASGFQATVLQTLASN